MAEETTASVIPLHQVPPKKKAKTGAERAKADRPRKRQKAKAATSADAGSPSSEPLIPPEFLSADPANTEPPATRRHATEATLRLAEPVKPSRRQVAPVLLSIAALGLAAVGITINGWFARSLGSSDLAGWLFLAIGVAADLVALVMPSCAAGLWQDWTAGHRAGRLGRVAHDLRLCGDGGYRVCVRQHRGRDAGARVTRDAGRPDRPGRA